jgi:carbon monoxide dehydrogenase subunit G
VEPKKKSRASAAGASERRIMPKVDTSIEIARPREEVFAYLTDLGNAKEWSTELVNVTYDGDLAQGTTGADIRRMGRKEIVMPWTITAFDPPNRVTFEYTAPFPVTADFSFRSTGAGTLVTCSMNLRPRGFWRLLGPLLAREGKKSDQAQFRKVKHILEGRRV